MPSEKSPDPETNMLDRSLLTEDKRSDLSMITSPYLLSRFLQHVTSRVKHKASSPQLHLTVPSSRPSLTLPGNQCEPSLTWCRPGLESPHLLTVEASPWGSLDRTSTSDLSDVTPEDYSTNSAFDEEREESHVALPCRYRVRLAELTSVDGAPLVDAGSTSNSEGAEEKEDMTSREQDLTTALKWIKQEILQMKEQDKCLQKQFIELRTSILQLRCLYEMHGSYSDVSSLEGSTYSLNEPIKSSKLKHLLLDRDPSFNKLSISLPSSPMVERFKWRNDEYV